MCVCLAITKGNSSESQHYIIELIASFFVADGKNMKTHPKGIGLVQVVLSLLSSIKCTESSCYVFPINFV